MDKSTNATRTVANKKPSTTKSTNTQSTNTQSTNTQSAVTQPTNTQSTNNGVPGAASPKVLIFDRIDTPTGVVILAADDLGALRILQWEADNEDRWTSRVSRLLCGMETDHRRDPFGHSSALAAYFAGDLAAIDGIAVSYAGTPFQNSVWRALRTIPAGTTQSYGGLARQIGRPKAVRAVGLANGTNPVGIVVPCHRVIGSDGSMTGYGGGLPRKRWLLAHEARHGARDLFSVSRKKQERQE